VETIGNVAHLLNLNDQHHHQFLRLFAEHEPALRTYIRSLLPSRGDASEVLQEVAVVLWRKFAEFDASRATRDGRTAMKPHRHEYIQQYVDGQSSAEAVAVLRKALGEDAELRAVYLDYINLDVALGALADAAAVEGNRSIQTTTLHEARAGSPPHHWRWAGAAAAFAALVVFAMLPGVPKPSRPGQDVAAAIASSRDATARLSFDTTSALPAWMSPTASLLEPPRIPE
jgi:hypothetical protein